MTLGQRLLLATAFLTIAATTTVGYGVRRAWQKSEERRFREEFQAALKPLHGELVRQLRELPELLRPLCAHDPLVDGALVGLEAGDLEARRLSLSLRVPELGQALGLDELYLIASTGEVLGAHDPGLVGKRDPVLAKRLRASAGRAALRREEPAAVEAACVRKDSEARWVGLLAVRHVGPTLERIGAAHGVALSLGAASGTANDAMVEQIAFPELGGVSIVASRSRVPLTEALRDLDATILLIGGGTLVLALGLALLLSRGLARPMVELARQAREVMRGEPRPIVASGPREIEESAEAFNQAIGDLIALRSRLAATERIAAWQEIAKRVAHEIKNPLAPIRAALETLRRLHERKDTAFEGYFDEATRTALGEVARIDHIVSEFTRFARLPPPKPEALDVVELAREVVRFNATGGAPVTLVAREGCPTIYADRDQLTQVLTNLIKNALEALEGSPKAEGERRVSVEVRAVGEDRVRISVTDNGPGIPAEIRGRLFLPYATTKKSGTGLGLAIAQRLVHEHGGVIGVVDVDGGGTEVRVEVPVGGPGENR